jgi:hypothetical protein
MGVGGIITVAFLQTGIISVSFFCVYPYINGRHKNSMKKSSCNTYNGFNILATWYRYHSLGQTKLQCLMVQPFSQDGTTISTRRRRSLLRYTEWKFSAWSLPMILEGLSFYTSNISGSFGENYYDSK